MCLSSIWHEPHFFCRCVRRDEVGDPSLNARVGIQPRPGFLQRCEWPEVDDIRRSAMDDHVRTDQGNASASVSAALMANDDR